MGMSAAAVLVAVLAGAPPGATNPAAASATPERGTFAGRIAIGGGRELFLRCKGSGEPVVFLESGIHDSSDPWALTQTEPPVASTPAVFSGVARFTRVCRYDRPGTIRYTNPPRLTTRSTPVQGRRTLREMATDLRMLLTRSGIPGPYTLVGHSFGGMIVRLYAQTHPTEVAGLVLVDAFGTNIRRRFDPDLWPAYTELFNRPGTPLDSDPRFETVDVDGAIDAVVQAPRLSRVPLAVMSKTQPFAIAPDVDPQLVNELERAWPHVQNALVKLEPRTPHILATGSDHYVQMHAPDLTIGSIRLVVERARRAQ